VVCKTLWKNEALDFEKYESSRRMIAKKETGIFHSGGRKKKMADKKKDNTRRLEVGKSRTK